jgi:hypothetical protein
VQHQNDSTASAADRRTQLLADAERARLFAENAGQRGRLAGLVTAGRAAAARLARSQRRSSEPL